MSQMGQNPRLIGVSATDGLPSAADAPLQGSELAKSAICRPQHLFRVMVTLGRSIGDTSNPHE